MKFNRSNKFFDDFKATPFVHNFLLYVVLYFTLNPSLGYKIVYQFFHLFMGSNTRISKIFTIYYKGYNKIQEVDISLFILENSIIYKQ